MLYGRLNNDHRCDTSSEIAVQLIEPLFFPNNHFPTSIMSSKYQHVFALKQKDP